MTGELRDLLHEQASLPHFDPVTTDVVAEHGRRAVRRRRGLRAGAVVGGLAVLVVVGVTLTSGGGGDSQVVDPVGQPVATPAYASEVTWVAGSVLHTPDSSVDLGHPVRAYVATGAGVVYADPTGRVWSFADGTSTQVGSTSAATPHLISDGDSAGWVDPTGADLSPVLEVLNQRTGQVDTIADTDLSQSDDPKGADLLALDGTTAYVLDDRGIVALDTTAADPAASGQIVETPGSMQTVLAAQGGTVAFSSNSEGLSIGSTPLTASTLQSDSSSSGEFSPDGAYLAVDADDLLVFDTTSRTQAHVPTPGYGFAAGYGWVDDSTVTVIASHTDTSHPDLLTCDVVSGSCTVAVHDVGSFDQFGSGALLLPVGSIPDS